MGNFYNFKDRFVFITEVENDSIQRSDDLTSFDFQILCITA